MIFKNYQNYLTKLFFKNILIVGIVFIFLSFFLNIFEELKYLEDKENNIFKPILLTILNIPSIVFEILPFIFLLGVMFFFINLYEKEEVELLRSHGIDNYKITTIISLASLIMGILLVVIYYSFSANLKSLYLNFKYQFSDSSDHLAVVNEDGLWIKEKNGGKIFITNAGVAGILNFTTQIIENGENKGIGAFIVPTDIDGLTIGPSEKKMGWKASDTRQLFFENMSVPKVNMIAEPGEGFKTFLKTLTSGRISVAALAVGTAEGAYNRALRYSEERSAFGRKIHQFQPVGFKLADMATDIEASKLLIYHAAWMKDQNKDIVKEAAMAKLFASETAMRVATDAIQIHGGYGYVKEYDVERYFRDAKILEIGEGTSEIQRLIISREILKELQHNAL